MDTVCFDWIHSHFLPNTSPALFPLHFVCSFLNSESTYFCRYVHAQRGICWSMANLPETTSKENWFSPSYQPLVDNSSAVRAGFSWVPPSNTLGCGMAWPHAVLVPLVPVCNFPVPSGKPFPGSPHSPWLFQSLACFVMASESCREQGEIQTSQLWLNIPQSPNLCTLIQLWLSLLVTIYTKDFCDEGWVLNWLLGAHVFKGWFNSVSVLGIVLTVNRSVSEYYKLTMIAHVKFKPTKS